MKNQPNKTTFLTPGQIGLDNILNLAHIINNPPELVADIASDFVDGVNYNEPIVVAIPTDHLHYAAVNNGILVLTIRPKLYAGQTTCADCSVRTGCNARIHDAIFGTDSTGKKVEADDASKDHSASEFFDELVRQLIGKNGGKDTTEDVSPKECITPDELRRRMLIDLYGCNGNCGDCDTHPCEDDYDDDEDDDCDCCDGCSGCDGFAELTPAELAPAKSLTINVGDININIDDINIGDLAKNMTGISQLIHKLHDLADEI